MAKVATFTEASREAGRRAVAEAKDAKALLAVAKLDLGERAHRMVLLRLEQMPAGYRRTYIRAMRGKSFSAAVRANCAMCVGWQRAERTACSDPACPLFAYRPSR